MKRQPRILAGTALGLLMASAPLGAVPLLKGAATELSPRASNAITSEFAPLWLAQAECLEGESAEDCAARQAAEQAPAEEPEAAPAEEPAPEEPAVEEPAAEEPAPEPEAAPAEEPVPEEPAAEEPAPEPEAAPAEEPAMEEPAAEEPAAEPEAAPAEEPAMEEPAAEEPAVEEPAAEEPAVEEPAAEEPAAEEPAADAPAAEEPAVEEPATEEPAAGEPVQEGEAPADPDAAPILDSQKQDPAAAEDGGQAAEPAEAPAEAAPPPASDAEAQAEPVAPEDIEPVTAEEGERIEVGETTEERIRARSERIERRENAEVIEEYNDNRVIIEINNQIYIESPDYERIIYNSDEVYYEELSNGRFREVIVRDDGSRVITIRNRYGDIIRRSRILPDNREIILVYVEDRYYDEVLEFRDPGFGLPPLVLSIPREEYILEANLVQEPEAYYTFLDQPPVEKVERTYSLNEVKRSARIRDKVRRVDLDTITFEFGSATIPESEISKLEDVATAIERMLEENPAETFLIEGHTDAVGSDLANLALSDRRAEAVANALTNVFAIAPENLATQGYGEQFLKVNTEEPEEENRRVAIRRITPLVTPVASAN